MDATIEPVAPADIPILLELIRELANFEHLEHEVQATEEMLKTALFSQNAVAGALLAKIGADAAGYAIYFFTFSSFVGRTGIWLEDLYVRPTYRRRGLGKRLLQSVARIGVDRNCGRFEWTALNWNRKALEFYQSLGARVMDEWHLLRMETEGLRRVAEPAESRQHTGR